MLCCLFVTLVYRSRRENKAGDTRQSSPRCGSHDVSRPWYATHGPDLPLRRSGAECFYEHSEERPRDEPGQRRGRGGNGRGRRRCQAVPERGKQCRCTRVRVGDRVRVLLKGDTQHTWWFSLTHDCRTSDSLRPHGLQLQSRSMSTDHV